MASVPRYAFGPATPSSGFRAVPSRQVPTATVVHGKQTHPGSIDWKHELASRFVPRYDQPGYTSDANVPSFTAQLKAFNPLTLSGAANLAATFFPGPGRSGKFTDLTPAEKAFVVDQLHNFQGNVTRDPVGPTQPVPLPHGVESIASLLGYGTPKPNAQLIESVLKINLPGETPRRPWAQTLNERLMQANRAGALLGLHIDDTQTLVSPTGIRRSYDPVPYPLVSTSHIRRPVSPHVTALVNAFLNRQFGGN